MNRVKHKKQKKEVKWEKDLDKDKVKEKKKELELSADELTTLSPVSEVAGANVCVSCLGVSGALRGPGQQGAGDKEEQEQQAEQRHRLIGWICVSSEFVFPPYSFSDLFQNVIFLLRR